jgi:hypothetical protein
MRLLSRNCRRLKTKPRFRPIFETQSSRSFGDDDDIMAALCQPLRVAGDDAGSSRYLEDRNNDGYAHSSYR